MADARGIPASYAPVPLPVPLQLAAQQGAPVAFIPVSSFQPGADPLRGYATMLAAAPGGYGAAGLQAYQMPQLMQFAGGIGNATTAAMMGHNVGQSKLEGLTAASTGAQPMLVPMLMNGMDLALQQSMLAGVAAQGLQGFGQPVFIPVPVAGLPYGPAPTTPASPMALLPPPQTFPFSLLPAPAATAAGNTTPGAGAPPPPSLLPLPQLVSAPTPAPSLSSIPLSTVPSFQSPVPPPSLSSLATLSAAATLTASNHSPAAALSPTHSGTQDTKLAHTTPPRAVGHTQNTHSTSADGLSYANLQPQQSHSSRTNPNANAIASSSHASATRSTSGHRGAVRASGAHGLSAHGGHRHGFSPYSALKRQEHMKARRLAELRARQSRGRDGRAPVRRPHITQETSFETLMNMSAEELGAITVRELNSWFNSSNLSEAQIRELKKRRRRMKNRAYARSCRARKETSVTERQREIDRLRAELGTTREQLGSILRERDALRLELDQLSRAQALLRSSAIQSVAQLSVAATAHQFGAQLGMAAVGAPISAVGMPVTVPMQIPISLSPNSHMKSHNMSASASRSPSVEPPSADTLAAASVLAGMPVLRDMR